MSSFSIDIRGDVAGKMDKLKDNVLQVVEDELNAFGLETVAMAKTLVPVDDGFLRNSITFDKFPLSVEIVVASNYAAYVEFGTGVFAAAYVPTLPPELQEYAKRFFINGKGRIPAKPFLFPALEVNKKILIDNLKAVLK